MRKTGLLNSHAVKIVPKSPNGDPDEFQSQSVLHNKFQHFNLVRHFPMSVDKNYHFVGMERLGGNLSTFLEETPTHPRPGLAAICSVLSGIVNGLSFLESKNQGYGALHPGNILIGRSNCGVLGDFFFTHPSPTNPHDIERGRCAYLAPELVGGPDAVDTTVATSRSDVWSFGVIVMESVVGVNPFKGLSSTTLRTRMISFDLEGFVEGLNESAKSRMTPALKQLLSECLRIVCVLHVRHSSLFLLTSQTPTDRTTFSSIRQRRLLRSLLTTQEEINTFNEAIIQQQQDQLSQSFFSPALTSENVFVTIFEGSLGALQRCDYQSVPFHPQMSVESFIGLVRQKPGREISLLMAADGHLLDRCSTLEEAGVTIRSNITLFPRSTSERISFFVRPSSCFYVMEYKETHHRMNTRAFITNSFNCRHHLIDHCTLHGEDGRLIDLRQTMIENGIHAGSVITIEMERDGPFVLARTLMGTAFPLDVDFEHDTIADVTEKVHNVDRIPAEQIRLFHAGMQLENGRTLNSYDIQKGETLKVTVRESIWKRKI
ncbi:putative Protein kinase domain containing protein [Blattamonas nauphoetae]|uniref:Uncharacterized protein n=1 Tax=Blattamonas nauphoetae TaxID=2049346 RepID=A0ABQ9Y954_9EUKA|nr:putative Protein kinase domain containing protein [Blattamonas nauphoetae]